MIARQTNFAIVYSLIKHGANPNGTGALQWAVGRLASYEAIDHERIPWKANKIAQLLIEEGHADVNEIPPEVSGDATLVQVVAPLCHALLEAAYFENYRLVDYLLDHGADPFLWSESDGSTIWDIACSKSGGQDLIELLVRRGISPATLWGILKS